MRRNREKHKFVETKKIKEPKKSKPATQAQHTRQYARVDFIFRGHEINKLAVLTRNFVTWPIVQHLQDNHYSIKEKHVEPSTDQPIIEPAVQFSDGQVLQFDKDVDVSVIDAGYLILKAWRSLACKLTTNIVRKQILHNCFPSLIPFFTRGKAPVVPCSLWATCPWCFGRSALLLRRVCCLDDEGAFTETIKGRAVTLFQHDSEIRIDNNADSSDRHFLRQASVREKNNCAYLRLNNHFAGFYWNNYVGFSIDPADGASVWCLRTRALAIHSRYAQLTALPNYWTSETTVDPTQGQLESLVSLCTTYNPEVLTTDPALIKATMEARKSLRMTAYSGVLRDRKRQLTTCDSDDSEE